MAPIFAGQTTDGSDGWFRRMLQTDGATDGPARKLVTKPIGFHFPELFPIPNESPQSILEISKVLGRQIRRHGEGGVASVPENDGVLFVGAEWAG